jgi:intracellular sulfur oxidation DsrE/DsrF family protein
MKSRHPVSDEQLSAFIDDQLDRGEKDQLFAAAQEDPELLARACDYRQLKEMLKHAYSESGQGRIPATPPRARFNLQALAATLLLGLGGLLGWAAHSEWFGGTRAAPGHILQLGGAMEPLTGTSGVLLHLSSHDPAKMEQALDRVEALLAYFEQTAATTQVELLMNGSGLDLVRDTTPYADRIHELTRRYANITLLACNKALERYRLEHGEQAHLINDASVTDSALEQIVGRLKQGWTYIQI